MRIGEFTTNMLTMARLASANSANASQAAERLATGKRINRASDDPAGLAIAQKLTSQAAQYNAAASNIEQGTALLNTMDAAYSSMSDGVNRLKELSVQYADSTLTTDQKTNIETEAKGILDSMAESFANTDFNGIKLFQQASFTLGSGYGAGTTVTTPGFKVASDGSGGYNITANGSTQSSQTVANILASGYVDTNLATPLSSARGYVGAVTSGMTHELNAVRSAAEQATKSLSTVQDADIALESANLAKDQVLTNSALGMMGAYSQQMRTQIGSILNINM